MREPVPSLDDKRIQSTMRVDSATTQAGVESAEDARNHACFLSSTHAFISANFHHNMTKT
jgi:hypothetical protein